MDEAPARRPAYATNTSPADCQRLGQESYARRSNGDDGWSMGAYRCALTGYVRPGHSRSARADGWSIDDATRDAPADVLGLGPDTDHGRCGLRLYVPTRL